MTKLKTTFIALASLFCALAFTGCMDLYDSFEVATRNKITFVGNGGVTSDGQSTYTQEIDVGKEGNLTHVLFTRTDYSFVGWSLDENATTTKYVD